MAEAPLVWLLLGAKAGDNAQVRELGARLPMNVVAKQLNFNRLHNLPNVVLGASVASVDDEARKLLVPPWPQAVISAGKRSVPIARWIKDQSQGHTKLIHIGRPRTPLTAFDLVLTTPQYGLPGDANVLELRLPLAAQRPIDPEELAKWRDQWGDLPQPLFCVAVGAAKFPIRLGEAEADVLANRLNTVVGAAGGSAIVLASPRSDERIVNRLAAGLKIPNRVYVPFQRDNNPYSAALRLCERVIVTSDSASMIADGLTAGKPVDVFRLPVSSARVAWSAKHGAGAALSRAGLLQPPRAMDRIVERLLTEGYVGELGGRSATRIYPATGDDVTQRVIQVINSR